MILSCYVAIVYRKLSLKSSFFEKAMFPVSEEQRKERKNPDPWGCQARPYGDERGYQYASKRYVQEAFSSCRGTVGQIRLLYA